MLERRVIEAQGYLECQNILETLGKRNSARLEAASQALLNMRAVPNYSTLKRLMVPIDSDGKAPTPPIPAASTAKPSQTPQEPDQDVLVRGADYYKDRW